MGYTAPLRVNPWVESRVKHYKSAACWHRKAVLRDLPLHQWVELLNATGRPVMMHCCNCSVRAPFSHVGKLQVDTVPAAAF